MVLLAALGYAIGAIWVRRDFVGVPPVAVAAGTMIVASIATLPPALARPGRRRRRTSAPPRRCSCSASAGPGIAFYIFFWLIAEVGAEPRVDRRLPRARASPSRTARSSSASRSRVSTIAGLALILAGSWLAAEGRLPWRRSGTRSCCPSRPARTCSAEVDLAVRARASLRALDEVQPLDRGAEQPRDEPQARVLRAQVEQALLGVEPEVDRRRHLVGASSSASSLGVGLVVGRLLDELARRRRARRAASGSRRAPRRGRRGTRRRRPGRAGRPARSTMRNGRVPRARRFMRPSGMRSSTSAISHAQPIVAQPVVGQPDDPELALLLEALARSSSCSAPRRCAAGRARSAARRARAGRAGSRARAVGHATESTIGPRRAARRTLAACLRPRSSGSGATCASTTTRALRAALARARARRAGVRARRRGCSTAASRRGPRTRSCSAACASSRGAARARRRRSSSAHGRPEDELPALAREVGARAPSTWPATSRRSRWRATGASTRGAARGRRRGAPAARATSSPTSARRARRPASRTPSSRRSGAPGSELPRRDGPRRAARAAALPRGLAAGRPAAPTPGLADELPEPFAPGEARRASAATRWLATASTRYDERHDRLAGGTSRALAVPALRLHLAARARGARARRGGAGAAAFVAPARLARLLRPRPAAPSRTTRAHEFQERDCDGSSGTTTTELLDAWREGRTGYPLVDAGMRQLRATRLDAQPRAADRRLVPDQGPAPRLARAARRWFMRLLLDGDDAAEQRQLAVDRLGRRRPGAVLPAHVQPRRSSSRRHDPDGEYVRRWVPELRDVPARAARRAVDDERRRAGGGRLRDRRATTRRRSSTTRTSAGARWSATGRWSSTRHGVSGGAPNVRRTCSSVEASSSCVASRVASPRSQRRVAARLSPVQHSSA